MLTPVQTAAVTPFFHTRNALPSTGAGPEVMPDAVTALLSQSVDAQLHRTAGPMDRGGWPALVAPGMTTITAGAMIGKAGESLRTALLASIGARDPIAHEEGAGSRLSEAGAGAHAWLVSSSVVLLLVMAREVLLLVEEVERASNARQVNLSYDTACRSANMAVSIATTRFGGAFASAALGAAIGAAGLSKSVKANNTSGKGVDFDKAAAQRINAGGKTTSGGIRAEQTPPGNLRPDRALSSSSSTSRPPAPTTGANANTGANTSPRPSSSPARDNGPASPENPTSTVLTADDGAAAPAMTRVAIKNNHGSETRQLGVGGERSDLRAQAYLAKGAYITTMAMPVGGIAESAAGIHAGEQEAAKKTLETAADVMKATAEQHRDQAATSRQAREDFAQSLRQFLELENATSSQIIKGI